MGKGARPPTPQYPGAGIWGYFEAFLVIFRYFATFSGVFGHFGGILGVFWIGGFCGIASRSGLRRRRPPTSQYPPAIPISLNMGHTEGVSEKFQNQRHRHVRWRRAALSFAFIGSDPQLSARHTETINRTAMSSRTSARKRKDPGDRDMGGRPQNMRMSRAVPYWFLPFEIRPATEKGQTRPSPSN